MLMKSTMQGGVVQQASEAKQEPAPHARDMPPAHNNSSAWTHIDPVKHESKPPTQFGVHPKASPATALHWYFFCQPDMNTARALHVWQVKQR